MVVQPESLDGGELRAREVRLGLVMYGGVSLAIYINGVAREFFRAVRGSGVYKLVKALTDSDVVVDVISGTSAGGINGIMLAYALCNNADFASSAQLWRRDADIRSLLRSPDNDPASAQSLLNSEGYYQPRLEDAFRYMPAYVPEGDGEINSKFDELDLYVTGTDVDGAVFTQFDDAGHPIDVKEHRSVFLLKHRRGRKEPFNPSPSYEPQADREVTYRSLAKLARITSCFPAAFTPVFVSKGETAEDRLLQSWGRLEKESSFLDGGVLDNKPFTYALKEIFNRVAERRVDRKFFYVEPDPEHLSKLETASQPNFVQAVIASLIGIPGYESISDDLKLLAQHNSKLSQYKRLVGSLGRVKLRDVSTADVRRLYVPSRMIALSERVAEGLLRTNGKSELLDQETRRAGAALIKAFDKLEQRRENEYKILSEFDVYYRLRRLFHVTYVIEEQLHKKDHPKEAEYKKLWRAVNLQIKLLDIIRLRMEGLVDEAPIEWKSGIAGARNEAEVASVAEAIWGEVSRHMRRLVHENTKLAEFLTNGYQKRLAGETWPEQKDLTRLDELLGDTVAEIIRGVRDKDDAAPAPQNYKNIFTITDAYQSDILKQCLWDKKTGAVDRADPVYKAYDSFLSVDVLLFPIEFVAGLHEKDIIETVRISPRDATKGFSNKGLSDKVSGDALYHFGGFFKRSWRSNDILWGRLDGLCQLVETLLNRQALQEVVEKYAWRNRVRGQLFENPSEPEAALRWRPSMDPARLFPQAGAETHRLCREWLLQLLSNDAGQREQALEHKNFEKNLELVIEAAQLEVLKEEVPNVIIDALGEQAQWNQFRLSLTAQERLQAERRRQGGLLRRDADGDGAADFDPLGFEPAGGDLDPFVAVVAATGRAESVMERFRESKDDAPPRPSKTKLGRFFKNQYAVGTEELLRDIPRVILLEIVAVSMLVLRNCVLGIFGERAAKVRSHPLYMLGIDYPLRVFYGLVLFLRRAPRAWKFLLATAAIVSALALAVGLYWRRPIVYSDDSFSFTFFGLFIALPLAVLVSESIYLWKKDFGGRRWTYLLRGLLGALGLAVLLVAPLVFGAAYAGIERVYDASQEAVESRLPSLFGRVPFYGAWLTSLGGVWQGRIARAGVITTGALLFLSPYLGAYLLLRKGKKSRHGAGTLEKALGEYFNLSEMEGIARRLVSSEVIERRRLLEVLRLYTDAEDFIPKIEPLVEIEWTRWAEAFAEYLPESKLKSIRERLGIKAGARVGTFLSYLNRSLPYAVDTTRLREVLKDYLGSDPEELDAAVGRLLPPAAPPQGTLLARGVKRCSEFFGSAGEATVADGAGRLPRGRAAFSVDGRGRYPAQRRMLDVELVNWRQLKGMLEDYVSAPEIVRIVSERLGLPAEREVAARPREEAAAPAVLTYERLRQVLKGLDADRGVGSVQVPRLVQSALETLSARLDDAKLVEWSKVRRAVEESLSVGGVIAKIRPEVERQQAVKGEELMRLLKEHYILGEESQKIEETLLALHGHVWGAGGQQRENEVLITALGKDGAAGEAVTDVKERLSQAGALEWDDVRTLLREFFSEEDTRGIASAVVAHTSFAWDGVAETLRKHLCVGSIVKKIAGRLTTSMAGAESTPARQRTAMAARLVKYAQRNNLLRQLQDQMSFVNPEVIYYL